MSRDSLVSVIIPTYNREQYLAGAIESVLSQTYPSIEIIVVDDGCTDGSAAVAKSFGSKVRYEYQPHAGAGAARNRGVDLAEGSFIAFLDADDLWLEDKLSRQVDELQNHPDLHAVFGHIRQFYSPELDQAARKTLHCPTESMPGYSPITLLIRREAFLRVGLFETSWQRGEFIDWYIRATEGGLRARMLPEVVAMRRLHGTNKGLTHREAAIDYTRILRASLARRRGRDIIGT